MSAGHVHVYPVDPSQTPQEAWHEQCLMGVRATYTGEASWATIRCDGEECWRIAEAAEADKQAARHGHQPR